MRSARCRSRTWGGTIVPPLRNTHSFLKCLFGVAAAVAAAAPRLSNGETSIGAEAASPLDAEGGGRQGGNRLGAGKGGEGGRKGPNLTIKKAVDMNNSGRVSVYVYDGPAFRHHDLIKCYRDGHGGVPPWQDERADMAQDMGEIWLHKALLIHPWRVLDPEDADIFFVPLYPVLSYKLLGKEGGSCGGLTHNERMTRVIKGLTRESTYFNRFGGADHVVVCAWWNCRSAVNPWQRMLLRRTVVAINEQIFRWSMWGCRDKQLAVPYTASSVLTASQTIGGLAPEERDIPFFFVGTGRDRPERQNLEVVKELSSSSVIELGGNEKTWGMNATVYAEHMIRSRFCFCPRGDTASSRRVYDSLAAGCIPIVTATEAEVLPFVETGLKYSDFSVVAPVGGFGSHENVTAMVNELSSWSDDQLATVRRGMRTGVRSIVYGSTMGPETTDMFPFSGTSTRFLKAVRKKISDNNIWSCTPTGLPANDMALRTAATLPPPSASRRQWLFESETIVNKKHSVMFCAPPNTGSLQFRMLAKRMEGVEHWSVSDDPSLLFDRELSGLPVLDVTDGQLMRDIFKDGDSGWIKIGVVRDPVTRLLSAYLDLVRAWRSILTPSSVSTPSSQGHRYRRRRRRRLRAGAEESGDDGGGSGVGGGDGRGGWIGAEEGRRWRGERGNPEEMGVEAVSAGAEGVGLREGERWTGDGGGEGEDWESRRGGSREEIEELEWGWEWQEVQGDEEGGDGGWGEWRGSGEDGRRLDEKNLPFFFTNPIKWNGGGGGEGGGDGDGDEHKSEDFVIPTFGELVDALAADVWRAPPPFRSLANMCGARHSALDAVIPFERLEETATEVVKSLPDGIWDSYGSSGWGPDGSNAFMEFDYGGVWSSSLRDDGGGSGGGGEGVTIVGGVGDDGGETGAKGDTVQGGGTIPGKFNPRRARDLFEGGSCAWAEFYADVETLEQVGAIFEVDYNLFRWYDFDAWRTRLKACLEKQ